MSAILLLLLGLAALLGGAESLVRGASRLAARFGVSPLIIGLTVVAYGTSAPELAVSVFSARSGQPEIAIGNVVGSNIFNVLVILGVSALMAPLVVSRQLVRLDVPLMIAASVLAYLLVLDGRLGRADGAALAAAAVVYTLWLVALARKGQGGPENKPADSARAGVWVPLLRIVIGLVLLVAGSRWLVAGASVIARAVGASDLVIGLTIIAGGTSLPELATSVVASWRGERDIAVGNVVGSNLFNLLVVLGGSAFVTPGGLPVAGAAVSLDFPVMLAVAAACLPIFFTGHRIARWEGGLFFGYYVAYVVYLVLSASQHDALPVYRGVMLLFVTPITAVTLLVLAARALHSRS